MEVPARAKIRLVGAWRWCRGVAVEERGWGQAGVGKLWDAQLLLALTLSAVSHCVLPCKRPLPWVCFASQGLFSHSVWGKPLPGAAESKSIGMW